MQGRTGKITYGAMMIALFVILLFITMIVPVLGFLTMFVIPLPILLYRLRFDRSSTILVVAGSILLATMMGGIATAPFAFVFAPMGFVIGDTIQQKKTKLYTFMASGLWILLVFVATYALSVLLFGLNIIDEVMKSLRTTQDNMIEIMMTVGEVPKNFEKQMADTLTFYEVAIPSVFIIASFSFAFIIVMINMAIIKRFGYKPMTFVPFRMMKLPKITVWSYFIIIILPFLMKIERGTMTELIYVNGTTILRTLFFIQGISFILYYMTAAKLPKWATTMVLILAVVISPVTTLLGILDAGMDLRNWVGRKKSK